MIHLASFTQNDRGLAYGDGLFETMRFSHDHLLWWPEHFARMCFTCCALSLPVPEEAEVRAAIDSAVGKSGLSEAVVKMIYTAGSGQRGYLRTKPTEPALSVVVGALPEHHLAWSGTGLTIGMLQQSGCAPIPALVGLKHLNRLPQVMARQSWPEGVDECLINDEQGLVLGGTQSNFYWLEDGQWYTPPIRGAAIAGTVRALLCHYLGVRVSVLSIGRLTLAQAAAMSNAVRGVLPVGRLAGRLLPVDQSIELQMRWHRLCEARGAQNGQPVDSAWLASQRQALDCERDGQARCLEIASDVIQGTVGK